MHFWKFHLWDFWTTYAFPLYVKIFVNESPTNIVWAWIKVIGKESSSVRIHFVSCQKFCLWVFMLHRRIKKGNDEIICAERLSSILFEKTFTKNFETKPVFFSWKKELFFEKKLNVWNEKTFASWWNKRKMLNILLSFHHIKFTDGKNEIFFKILFNFFVKHFQTLSWHAPSGAPACSPYIHT